MKIRILFTTLLLCMAAFTYAAHIDNVPRVLIQPNGDTLRCFASGDEFICAYTMKRVLRSYKISRLAITFMQKREMVRCCLPLGWQVLAIPLTKAFNLVLEYQKSNICNVVVT